MAGLESTGNAVESRKRRRQAMDRGWLNGGAWHYVEDGCGGSSGECRIHWRGRRGGGMEDPSSPFHCNGSQDAASPSQQPQGRLKYSPGVWLQVLGGFCWAHGSA